MDIYKLCRRIIPSKFFRKAFFFVFTFIWASILIATAQIRVVGTVTDNMGDLMPGVNVIVLGTNIGTSVDAKGEFTISVPNDSAVIQFTFVGYETQDVVVGSRRVITVTMREAALGLGEVTVVAFARQRRESVLASITTIAPSELKVASSNLTTAFAGRVAGLISYQQSGEPGQDNAQFFIRGITTFGAQAKRDPLILIDGMELSTEELARLNTDDIATFSVMKDATATALYGARGANGVIYVTTKEGREGKAVVNVRLESSFSMPTQKIELTDPITYMNMHNEAIRTRAPEAPYLYSPEKIYMTERGMYPDIFPVTDWYKVMLRDVTPNHRANISLSGGGSVARYYVAANVTQDNGNLKVDTRNNFNSNINLTKLTIRSNVNINLTKTTEIVLRMSASLDDYIGPMEGGRKVYNQVMRASPVLYKPYYEPDEQYSYVKHILFGNYGNGNFVNPYAEAHKGYREYSSSLMAVQFEGKQKLNFITEGLTARVMTNFNRDSYFDVRRQYNPFFYSISSYNLMENKYRLQRMNPETGTEWIDYNPNERRVSSTFYLEGAVEYTRTFGLSTVNALGVYTMRNHRVGSADDLQRGLPSRNLGVSGRLAYNFDTRYFAEFNFGYNGSERFSKDNRFGFFPSFGVGWMASNESFYEGLKEVIPTLKFRGTYGLVGNDAIGRAEDRFYYLSMVQLGLMEDGGGIFNSRRNKWGTYMNYNPGTVNVSRFANYDIGWEVAYKWNVAMEMTMRNGFSTIVEYFRERRENILIDRIIPNTMGIIPAVKANLGVGASRGVDVEANYEKSLNNGLWFIGRGTITYATNEVVEWEEPDYSATPWRSRVGRSIDQQWGYIAERLFIDEAEVKNSPEQWGDVLGGDIKYRDVDGDGRITGRDQVPIGFPTRPEINYGFGLSLGYKGLDFSFFFQGSARQSFWLEARYLTPFNNGDGDPRDDLQGYNYPLKVFADNYWSESNRNPYAMFPRLSPQETENNWQRSTWFMQDAGFLRLKNVEIGYTLSNQTLEKIRMKNLRVYVSGTNLFVLSRFKLWDPEMAGNGLGYPVQRVFNIGLNIGL